MKRIETDEADRGVRGSCGTARKARRFRVPGSVSLRISEVVLAAAILAGGCRFQRVPAHQAAAGVSYGVAAGEVTATSAIVWSRCDVDTDLTVTLQPVAGGEARVQRLHVDAAHDFTGVVRFDDLQPHTRYAYRAWCGDQDAPGTSAAAGRLQTAPAAIDPQAVRFIWSGDLGGQNVCRDRVEGYEIFDAMSAMHPDFFIALGDMIYADNRCEPVASYGYEQIPGPPAPATALPAFWAIWRYNRADRRFQHFLASTSYYAVWDDHEIMDDSGPRRDELPQAPGVHLMPLAREAFVDYQPMLRTVDPPRLYRSARWGRHLEVFFLDTRSYRDRNDALDRPQAPKTMLGAAQRAWLLDALRDSDATWKVIVSSVPLSIPTGTTEGGRDGWANFDGDTGFEHEALSLLRAMQQARLRHLLWITTDVHFATGFRYRPFADDPAFLFYEFTTGPLNAGLFPTADLDPTLRPERLFRYGPANPRAIDGFDEALPWFTFTVVDVDERGTLALRAVNGTGQTVFATKLDGAVTSDE